MYCKPFRHDEGSLKSLHDRIGMESADLGKLIEEGDELLDHTGEIRQDND